MIISIIAAMDSNSGIGVDNKLPWKLSADLKKFRELTLGHHIVVGRKTYESIGRPLPGRHTIIITRNNNFTVEGGAVDIVHSMEEAIRLAESRNERELFICGGAEIYSLAIDIASKMYLTFVDAEIQADTLFPEWTRNDWTETGSVSHTADESNQYHFELKTFSRNRK